MEWLITNTVAALLMPPGILVVALLAAVLLQWRRPRLARGLVLFALIALYALSIPLLASHLLRMLEAEPRDPVADRSGQAIVVLGGGTILGAPEYAGDTVNSLTLVRLRYASGLYRAIKKPVLTSGGAPRGGSSPEARLMRQVLQVEFHAPVQWVEDGSRNTLENARGSYQILNAAGINRVYLVTHAWHMPRARFAFESVGFSVIAAPTGYTTRGTFTVFDFMPNAQALRNSSWFFHEVLGLGWYHLKIALGR